MNIFILVEGKTERKIYPKWLVLKNKIKLNDSTDFIIILQRCCIETWFLANRKIFKKNPQDTELNNWIKHFNVSIDDPETMSLPTNYDSAIGNFHKMYLKKMLAERHINYSEIQPNAVTEPEYLGEIIKRFEQTEHIATFGHLLDFCKKLDKKG